MKILRFLTGRRFLITVALLLLFGTVFTWWCDHRIRSSASGFVFNSTEAIPANRIGLVLGTSEKMRGGRANPYFDNRIEAAAALYHAGKVEHLLVSGDNGRQGYNEPVDMRRALIAAGVDSTHITLDYAGFRTFDSMVRAREVFGQERFTVISQRFHNERAIYIGQQLGITAVGFNAADVNGEFGERMQWRERAARAKVFFDLAFGIEPHFLGDPVTIGQQPPP